MLYFFFLSNFSASVHCHVQKRTSYTACLSGLMLFIFHQDSLLWTVFIRNQGTVYTRYNGPMYNRLSYIMDHISTLVCSTYFISATKFAFNGLHYNVLSATADEISGNFSQNPTYITILPCWRSLSTNLRGSADNRGLISRTRGKKAGGSALPSGERERERFYSGGGG